MTVNENQTRRLMWPPAWRSWMGWHWGQDYPNSFRMGRQVAYRWKTEVTMKEQQELYDTAWLILKRHGVVCDTTTYALATELADEVSSIRDRQRVTVDVMFATQENRQQ